MRAKREDRLAEDIHHVAHQLFVERRIVRLDELVGNFHIERQSEAQSDTHEIDDEKATMHDGRRRQRPEIENVEQRELEVDEDHARGVIS